MRVGARSASAAKQDGWYLAAALLGGLFGYLAMRWTPIQAFEAALAVALLLICLARPYTGLLIIVALALCLETYGFVDTPVFFRNPLVLQLGIDLLGSSLGTVTGISIIYLSAIEVLLLVVTLSWVLRRLRAGTLRWQGGVLGVPLLLFAATLLLASVRGITAGGDQKFAFQEPRALFQLVIVYLLAAHMIERRSQVRALMWVVIGSLLMHVVMTWWYTFAVLHGNLGAVDSVTTHEEGLFFGSMLSLWACFALFGARDKQRSVLALSLFGLFVAFIAAKRRAAMMALLFAIPYLLALVNRERAKRLLVVLAAASLPLAAYVAAFWNSTSPIAEPVQMLRSVTEVKGRGRNEDSNRFRIIENQILYNQMKEHPLLGMGFGLPYRGYWDSDEDAGGGKKVGRDLPDLGYASSRYVPHNNIYWIWVKAGFLGFAALWFVVLTALAYGTHLARTLRSPYFRALAASVVLLLCMQMVVSFVDLQLNGSRNMIYLGAMLGMLARLRAIEKSEGERPMGR